MNKWNTIDKLPCKEEFEKFFWVYLKDKKIEKRYFREDTGCVKPSGKSGFTEDFWDGDGFFDCTDKISHWMKCEDTPELPEMEG